MSRDYETLYYEQQASFTESNGMLTRENEELRKRISEVQSELADWETATGCKTHPDAALRFELLQQRIEALTEELWDAKELSRQRMEYAENVAKAADEFLAAWENDLGTACCATSTTRSSTPTSWSGRTPMSELHSQDQLPTCTCMRKCDVRAQVGRRCRALNLPVTPSKTAESVEGTSLTDLADQVDQVAKLLENVVGHQDPDSFTIGAAVADLNGIARRLRGGRPLSQGAPSTPSYRFGCPRGRDGCNTPGECGAALRCCRAEAEKNGGGAST